MGENMKTLADAINEAIATTERKEKRKIRPLHEWPSDLLEWLFWSDEIQNMDPAGTVVMMIHHEMNARGEGVKVAV